MYYKNDYAIVFVKVCCNNKFVMTINSDQNWYHQAPCWEAC